ncbi:hypothetical protein [Serratia fonticola]|uniref:hypothetical protein n=1 Tax=Serratia fonticola TaxID=47917 RepID=UPI001376CFCC|nr:hypothetical protein [Serratia fonticola]
MSDIRLDDEIFNLTEAAAFLKKTQNGQGAYQGEEDYGGENRGRSKCCFGRYLAI